MTNAGTPSFVDGIDLVNVQLILTKKFKDNDKKKDLFDSFKYVNKDAVIEEGQEEDITKSDKFFDHLIYNGYKYTDDMAEVVLKEADPKNKGIFGYVKFGDNILKTDKKKKTKKKKAK